MYTTLAENLVRHDLTQQIKGISFIEDLKGFTVNSIQGEQLSDVEKEKLGTAHTSGFKFLSLKLKPEFF
ncbi:hypothetical protein ACFSQ7_27430 [Paenibacillus rhizoplanae]